jgi:hypothetical protein
LIATSGEHTSLFIAAFDRHGGRAGQFFDALHNGLELADEEYARGTDPA